MAVLDAKTRNALPDSDFALPGRQYPINDIVHARISLSMVAANGTAAQIAQVRAAVKKRYPSIEVSDMSSITRDVAARNAAVRIAALRHVARGRSNGLPQPDAQTTP